MNRGFVEIITKRACNSFVVTSFVAFCTCCNDQQEGLKTSNEDPIVSSSPVRAPRPFIDVTTQRGINFHHFTGRTGRRFIVEIMGSGVGLLDHDLDGDYDLYLVNGAQLPGTPKTPNQPHNHFYSNDGWGHFADITSNVGLGDKGYGMGIAVGDIENDGDPDLYLSNYGPDRLFRNRGDGTFEDNTERAQIDLSEWSTSSTFFDYDLDGDLDLYVTNYVDFHPDTFEPCSRAGQKVYCGPQEYGGLCDHLLRNNGEGLFEEVSKELGIKDCSGKGLGIVAGDFDGDGDPDLYVANDGTANFLYINQNNAEKNVFTEEALYYGAAFGYDAEAEAGMGTDMGDFDNDGDLDITVTNLEAQTNSLYRNDDGVAVMEVSYATGLGAKTLPYVGFGTCFIDFELDNDLDLIATNGHVIDNIQLIKESSSFEQENLLFENIDGHFHEILNSGEGVNTIPSRVGRGLAKGDIDGDGDEDIIINNNGSQPLLLLNTIGQEQLSVGLQLVGKPPHSNRDAYGAKVFIESRGGKFLREVHAGASYLASNDPRLHIGVPNGSKEIDGEIRWPSGLLEEFTGLATGFYHTIQEGSGLQKSVPFQR